MASAPNPPAVWVDNGQDPDYAKLARYGIRLPYFDPRDPRVTAAFLQAVADHPAIDTCGIYTAWSWQPDFTSPERYAEWTHEQLLRIGWQGNALVYLDIEKGANGITDATLASYTVACLKRWRQLRPTRGTALTFEGMQGGLFPPASVSAISSANVRVAPQLYVGAMQPQPHSPIIDLLMAGFPGDRLDGMYDGAALPYRWRGCAFTQGRLPS